MMSTPAESRERACLAATGTRGSLPAMDRTWHRLALWRNFMRPKTSLISSLPGEARWIALSCKGASFYAFDQVAAPAMLSARGRARVDYEHAVTRPKLRYNS